MASASEVSAGKAGHASFELSETGRSFVALLRWTSALVVLLAHLRAILFVGREALPDESQNFLLLGFYALTSFSHEAVIVFFVLSGFLVGGVNYERAERGRFAQRFYAIDRFTRIYVTLIPALLLTVAADAIGMRIFDWTGYYDGSNLLVAERFRPAFELKQGLLVFLGNMAMVQPVYTTVLGSNIPLWSLSYEVWFYLWFGIFASAIARPTLVARATVAVSTLVLGGLFQWLALYYLLIWCGGIVAYNWRGWPKWFSAPLVIIIAALALAASELGMKNVGGISVQLSDMPLAVGFAWLLNLMKSAQFAPLNRTGRLNLWASDFSYSLYVIHFPLMLLISAALAEMLGLQRSLRNGLVPSGWREFSLYLGTAGTVLVFAWAFSQLIERRTGLIRSGIKMHAC